MNETWQWGIHENPANPPVIKQGHDVLHSAEEHKPGSAGDCSCLSMAQYLFRINFPLTIFLQQHGDSLSINELSAKRQHLPQRQGIHVHVGLDCLYLSQQLAGAALLEEPA